MKAASFQFIACSLIILCVFISVKLSASDIDEAFSISLGNSLDLPVISKQVTDIEIFLIDNSYSHVPSNFKNAKSKSLLSEKQKQHFFDLLGKVGHRKTSVNGQVTTNVIGCFIQRKNASPGYIYLRNFQDGRWYLNFYNKRDSVGSFNQALGDFLWDLLEKSRSDD